MSRSIVLFVYVFGSSLFSQRVLGSPFLVSDLVLLIGVGAALVLRKKVAYDVVTSLGMLWLVLAAVGGVTLMTASAQYWKPEAFVLSFLRAAMGVGVLMTVIPLLEGTSFEKIAKAIVWTVRVHSGVVILFAILSIGFGLELYRVANVRDYGSNEEFVLNRFSGLFAEPAWFGWYIGLCLFAIAAVTRISKQKVFRVSDVILVMAAIVTTTSVGGAIVVGAGILVVMWTTWGPGRALSGLLGLAVFGFVVGVSIGGLGYSGLSVIMEYFAFRADAILSLKDVSALDRTLGSLEVLGHVVINEPWVGSGLGNEQALVRNIGNDLLWKAPTNLDVHISWVSAVVSTGIVGGSVYLLMLITTVVRPRSRLIGLGLVLSGLFWGGFLLATLWWFLGVGGLLARRCQRPIRGDGGELVGTR